jgi:hypothetical protein
MKCLKVAGLAVIAAAALTTFIGDGTASATVLCKTSATPCPEFLRWPSGTEILASLSTGSSAKETVEEGGPGNVKDTCLESGVSGKLKNEGSATETVTIEKTSISKSSCALGYPPSLSPSGMELHHIAGTSDGVLTGVGQVIRDFNCTYDVAQVGTLTGGEKPTLDLEIVLTKTGGLICTTPVGWDGTYSVTSPTPLYVTEG